MLRRNLICALAIGAVLSCGLAKADTIYYQPGFEDQLWSFDTDTGTDTFIGNLGIGATSMGMSFIGNTLYGYNRGDGGLYTIDTMTGNASLVGLSGLGGPESLTSDGSGNLYTVDGFDFYQLSTVDGSATFLGSLSTTIDGLSYDSVNDRVIGVDSGTLYEIDINNVTSTNIGSTVGADETLAFGPDGTLYGHGDDATFYEIDLNSGNATAIGNTSSTLVFASAVAQGEIIPEPSACLVSVAFLGMFAGRRRRRS